MAEHLQALHRRRPQPRAHVRRLTGAAALRKRQRRSRHLLDNTGHPDQSGKYRRRGKSDFRLPRTTRAARPTSTRRTNCRRVPERKSGALVKGYPLQNAWKNRGKHRPPIFHAAPFGFKRNDFLARTSPGNRRINSVMEPPLDGVDPACCRLFVGRGDGEGVICRWARNSGGKRSGNGPMGARPVGSRTSVWMKLTAAGAGCDALPPATKGGSPENAIFNAAHTTI